MEKSSIEKLHANLLTCWNDKDSSGMSALFTSDGSAIGFDGSQMNGRNEIAKELAKVFVDHKTASYVWKVEEVRFLDSDVAVLRAIVGMVPPDKTEINPETNAIQSVVAILENDSWKIALYQNTPAQFHGRPELVEQMTKKLTEVK